MSNRTQVLERFAAVTGLNPMTVEVILRYLGKAGLVPKGLPGRRSAHYSATHLKNLILALAAYQPSESVEAVRVLNDLICVTSASGAVWDKSFPDVEPTMSFGDWITTEIEARVNRIDDDYIVSDPAAPLFRRTRQIDMSVTPARASDTRPRNPAEKGDYVDFFLPLGVPLPEVVGFPALSRQTSFTIELLIAAGDLLADTLATQAATPIPDPVPGRTGEGDATPETTKAAGSGNHDGLLFEHPATQTRRRALLNKAQPTASQGRKQSCPDGAVSELRGSYPSAAKDHHNGTLWTDAASP